jgi:hypothetical protein
MQLRRANLPMLGVQQTEPLFYLAAAAAAAVPYVNCLLPEPNQRRAHFLGWVALAAKVPDPVECLIQVLLITVPVFKHAGTSKQWSCVGAKVRTGSAALSL